MTAQIFATAGVRVRLFSDIVPTPYVAFNVRFHELCLGVMCTARDENKWCLLFLSVYKVDNIIVYDL